MIGQGKLERAVEKAPDDLNRNNLQNLLAQLEEGKDIT
jgi:hypothetical protein